MSSNKTAITPTRSENYPEWYQQVINAADLAENSPVRGCMIIKPWGYAIWENIQRILDDKFKETDHVNAYFPLLIPLSLLEKEAGHVEGFAKECAVVTHSRLEEKDGKLIPASPLEEPLIIRPTSETIIGESMAKWINSYRDLPLKLNQWANVMRWEMRTRLFLRTSEFLWQEGHTAHATKEEAVQETLDMLNIYAEFARDILAMPVLIGEKTEDERFPGAINTYSIEGLMQDNKALQAGTSHFLGQNFSTAANIKYLDKDGQQKLVWTTSWGVSTRLIGGLIMTHSDDNGLVLPPKIAPTQIIILPIYRKEEDKAKVIEYAEKLKAEISQKHFNNKKIIIKIDNRDLNSGEKSWDAIKKGIPVRVEIGPRDLENNSVFVGTRDCEPRDKKSIGFDEFVENIENVLENIQNNIYQKALQHREKNTIFCQSLDEFKQLFSTDKNPGFVKAYTKCIPEVTKLLKELKATARCIELESRDDLGTCIFTGEKSQPCVTFARAY